MFGRGTWGKGMMNRQDFDQTQRRVFSVDEMMKSWQTNCHYQTTGSLMTNNFWLFFSKGTGLQNMASKNLGSVNWHAVCYQMKFDEGNGKNMVGSDRGPKIWLDPVRNQWSSTRILFGIWLDSLSTALMIINGLMEYLGGWQGGFNYSYFHPYFGEDYLVDKYFQTSCSYEMIRPSIRFWDLQASHSRTCWSSTRCQSFLEDNFISLFLEATLNDH